MKLMVLVYWVTRIIPAIILLQSLFFKFSGAEESKFIFTAIGMEPWGRIGTGIMELIASVLLLINPVAWIGALIALGLMGGAIVMHLTILGIEIQGDGGLLFIYAVVVAGCSLYVMVRNLEKIKAVIGRRR